MRDRLKAEGITLEEAENIVAHVVRERERWGKNYLADDLGVAKVLDAIIVITTSESSEVKTLRESLALSNRQLGAAKAREARRAKKKPEES